MKKITGKKLFRMTSKRRILLERIVTSINARCSSFEEDGLARSMIEHSTNLSEDEREKKLKEIDQKLKHYALLHDVLEVYTSRHWSFLLDIHMKEARGWKSEYDIPLEVFNMAIEDIITLLKWYQENSVLRKAKENQREYDENVKMLLLIKQYRNEQERLSNEA